MTEHGTATAGATPADAPPPSAHRSVGEEARTLAAYATRGVLSTIALDPAGHPFGSVVIPALLPDGSVLLCISRLAEHTKNLLADPRCSVVVGDDGDGNPLAGGRATLIGSASRVDDDAPDAAELRRLFVARHPDAAGYIEWDDFDLWTITVVAVRWVGGFGRMSWCTPEEYAAAEPDPTHPAAAGAIEHLNADHADALALIARTLAAQPDTVSAVAAGIDRYGLDLHVRTPERTVGTRVGFVRRVDDGDGLRGACVALVEVARTVGATEA